LIVKNLTRTSPASIGQLFRYVFNEAKQNPSGEKAAAKGWSVPFNDNEYFWSALRSGVRLSDEDLHHLHSDMVDTRLLTEYKKYGNDKPFSQFMQERSISKEINIRHGIKSKSLEGMTKEFQDIEESRNRKSNKDIAINHTVLAFDYLDSAKISDAILIDLTKKYMELRGLDSLYAGTIHRDKHPHVHLLQSATSVSGVSSRVSKQKFQEIKIALQEYQKQKYPELQSTPKHTLEPAKFYKNSERRLLDKPILEKCIATHVEQATSTKHFLELLQADGYSAYYRNSKLTGVTNEKGIKFRLSRFHVDMNELAKKDAKLHKEQQTMKEFAALRSGRQMERNRQPAKESLNEQNKSITDVSPNKALKQQACQDIRTGKDIDQNTTDERHNEEKNPSGSADEDKELNAEKDNDTNARDAEKDSNTVSLEGYER